MAKWQSKQSIKGKFDFGYQTEVAADGTAETVEPIPDPQSFDVNPKHTVIYATPFGIFIKEF
ncbi:MAG: hypothetical protein IV090_21565 [Candidatus Sericytochromatia bacterium]|nr:hypothetical protein [Candidatus Sericytochromatia bacterium]